MTMRSRLPDSKTTRPAPQQGTMHRPRAVFEEGRPIQLRTVNGNSWTAMVSSVKAQMVNVRLDCRSSHSYFCACFLKSTSPLASTEACFFRLLLTTPALLVNRRFCDPSFCDPSFCGPRFCDACL